MDRGSVHDQRIERVIEVKRENFDYMKSKRFNTNKSKAGKIQRQRIN